LLSLAFVHVVPVAWRKVERESFNHQPKTYMNLDIQPQVSLNVANTFTTKPEFELSQGKKAQTLLRWKKLALCKVFKRNGNFLHYETVLLDDDGSYPHDGTINVKIFAEREFNRAADKWLELLHKVPEHWRTLKNKTARRYVNQFAEVEPGDTSTFTRAW
jgi:hypothetical protein